MRRLAPGAVGARPAGRRDEPGSTTAEAAVVLPTLILFTVGLVWLVCLGATHVRAVDGARETARSLARGESSGTSVALGRRVAGDGATVSVTRGSQILVRVAVPVEGPGGMFGVLPTVTVRAEAVSVPEPGTPGATTGGAGR